MRDSPQFTDKCALERGTRIAQEKAPHFAAHLKEERARMEKVAEETAKMGFAQTAQAMKRFAHSLK